MYIQSVAHEFAEMIAKATQLRMLTFNSFKRVSDAGMAVLIAALCKLPKLQVCLLRAPVGLREY